MSGLRGGEEGRVTVTDIKKSSAVGCGSVISRAGAVY